MKRRRVKTKEDKINEGLGRNIIVRAALESRRLSIEAPERIKGLEVVVTCQHGG